MSSSDEERVGTAAGMSSGVIVSFDVIVDVESGSVLAGGAVSSVAVIGDFDSTGGIGSSEDLLEVVSMPLEVSSTGKVVGGVVGGISATFEASSGRGVATRVILSSGVAVAVEIANRKSGEGALLISGDVVGGLSGVSSFTEPSLMSSGDATSTAFSVTAGSSPTFSSKGVSEGVTTTTTGSPASLPPFPLLALVFDAVLCKSRLRACVTPSTGALPFLKLIRKLDNA